MDAFEKIRVHRDQPLVIEAYCNSCKDDRFLRVQESSSDIGLTCYECGANQTVKDTIRLSR